MQISPTDQNSFNGRFSPQTLTKFKAALDPNEFKAVKNFKAGKKYTQIDIVTIQREPKRLSSGIVVIPKETFAEFSNTKAKAGIKCRIKLADGELPFDMNTFKMFTEELIKRGEKLIAKFK